MALQQRRSSPAHIGKIRGTNYNIVRWHPRSLLRKSAIAFDSILVKQPTHIVLCSIASLRSCGIPFTNGKTRVFIDFRQMAIAV